MVQMFGHVVMVADQVFINRPKIGSPTLLDCGQQCKR